MNFDLLVTAIRSINDQLQQNAVRAINLNLTIRNWLVGYYIVEFEQNGEDRAAYGTKLLNNLAQQIKIKGLTAPELSRCRQFYTTYPEILGTVTQDLKTLIEESNKNIKPFEKIANIAIFGTLTQKLEAVDNKQANGNLPRINWGLQKKYQYKLLKTASFSHFAELIKITDATKRHFYEIIILKTTPSVRELQRAIETLTFERFGLTDNKEYALEQIEQKFEPAKNADLIKSHYLFDFLNINHPELIEEKEFEQALIDHLQDFILELGYGFCFEARQKRILIDDEYYFIDLVFYHRLLKCHVLVELKTEAAKYEHIGQLKVYLQHYKRMVMAPDDNPPVGILLVTDKKHTLIEYAVADSDQEIFVSKYLLQLPNKEQLAVFINNELIKQ